jgi:hypothetical protein
MSHLHLHAGASVASVAKQSPVSKRLLTCMNCQAIHVRCQCRHIERSSQHLHLHDLL